jgi:hypothetical protein
MDAHYKVNNENFFSTQPDDLHTSRWRLTPIHLLKLSVCMQWIKKKGRMMHGVCMQARNGDAINYESIKGRRLTRKLTLTYSKEAYAYSLSRIIKFL